jgi:hypothetical protein
MSRFNNRYEAVNWLEADMEERGIVLTADAKTQWDHWLECELPASDPMIACEVSTHRNLEIDTMKGKNTRKYWHPRITRTDGGVFEANAYVL